MKEGGKEVAVKIINKEGVDPRRVSELTQEAKILESLHQEHIVELKGVAERPYRGGGSKNLPWLVSDRSSYALNSKAKTN